MRRATAGAWGLLLSLLLATAAAARPAFYVKPDGDDRDDGRSPATAFRTLERAQSAMRASSDVKTAVLLPGIYARSAELSLKAEDSGETWTARPARAAVLDGLGTTERAIQIVSAGIRISGLSVGNYTRDGILLTASSDVVLERNRIEHIRSSKWSSGAIHAYGKIRRLEIRDNVISDTDFVAILYEDDTTSWASGLVIAGNSMRDTCRKVPDCGAIYVDDRAHAGRAVIIEGNRIVDFGATGSSRAIYLDDGASNVRATSNLICGPGQYAFQVHGGDHNLISGNTIVMKGIARLGLYQSAVATAGRPWRMDANVFSRNLIVADPADPTPSWESRLNPFSASLHLSGNAYERAVRSCPEPDLHRKTTSAARTGAEFAALLLNGR